MSVEQWIFTAVPEATGEAEGVGEGRAEGVVEGEADADVRAEADGVTLELELELGAGGGTHAARISSVEPAVTPHRIIRRANEYFRSVSFTAMRCLPGGHPILAPHTRIDRLRRANRLR